MVEQIMASAVSLLGDTIGKNFTGIFAIGQDIAGELGVFIPNGVLSAL